LNLNFFLFQFGGDFVDDNVRRLLLSDRFDGDDDGFSNISTRGSRESSTTTTTTTTRGQKSSVPPHANVAVIGDDALIIDLLLCRNDVTLSYVVAERSFGSDGEAADKAAIAELVDRLYEKYAFEFRQSFADYAGDAPAPQPKPKCQFETRVERVFAHEEVNMIVVATPPKSRRFFVEAAIAARKAMVLCKKPIVSGNDEVMAKLRADARANNVVLRELAEVRTHATAQKKSALAELRVEPEELRIESREIALAALLGLMLSVFGLFGFCLLRSRNARIALVIAVICNTTLIAVIASVLVRRAVHPAS
jgi:hypothetical protein